MRKQFSFKDNSRLDTQQDSWENRASCYYPPSNKDNSYLDHQRSQNSSWTDLRVQQIKRKYDTPSSRNKTNSNGCFRRHDRLKTEAEILSRSKSRYELYERFSSLRRETTSHRHLEQLSSEKSVVQRQPLGEKYHTNNQNVDLGSNVSKSSHFQMIESRAHLQRGESRQVLREESNIYKRQQEGKENQMEEDEVAVFKKIQQMKESLLKEKKRTHTNYSNASCSYNRQSHRPASNYSGSRDSLPLKQYASKETLDPRIKNIDKINQKIKQILDCLHDNENQLPKGSRVESREERSPCQVVFKHSVSKEISCQESANARRSAFEETKILERQEIRYLAEERKGRHSTVVQEASNKQQASLDGDFIKKSQSMYKGEEESITARNEKKWREEFAKEDRQRHVKAFQEDGQDNRSRSCLETGFHRKRKSSGCEHPGSKQKTEYYDEQVRLSSGKKLNEEIQKIQTRIKQFEEEKRKLSIKFRPFELQKNARSYSHHFRPPLPNSNKRNEPISTAPDQKNGISEFKFGIDDIIEKYKGKHTLPSRVSDSHQRKETERTDKMQSAEVSCRQPEPKSQDNEELRRKAGQGIQSRKRRLASKEERDRQCDETQRLVEKLSRQAQLDEKLRNAKIWLDASDKFPGKREWSSIKSMLYEKGVCLSDEETQREFSMTEDENNPFYSSREDSCSLQLLVQQYLDCRDYWENNIARGFDLDNLQSQNIQEGKIDLERKGYIIIEDLVRLLNIESGKFYRNRDLVLIWRRIAGERDRIDFNTFFRKIGVGQHE